MDPSTHRAITVDLSNGAMELQVHQSGPPPPGPHQVVVKILVRPIHPVDILTVRAPLRVRSFFHCHDQQTIVPGFEGFGIVYQVGDGVTEFTAGQRVIPVVWCDSPKQNGTWQDYVVIHESKVIPVPDSVPDEAAAQFIGNPWTAYCLMETLAVPRGEYIIQTAAASVLGRMVIQLAKYQGIKTINIVRREKWRSALKEIGADEVINSETEDVILKVKEITRGQLAYGGIDAVVGELTKVVGACVRDHGKVLLIGRLSSSDYTLSINDLFRGIEVIGWSLYCHINSSQKEKEVSSKVMELLMDHVITPLVGKAFALENYTEAIQESEKEARGGKVLLIG